MVHVFEHGEAVMSRVQLSIIDENMLYVLGKHRTSIKIFGEATQVVPDCMRVSVGEVFRC